MFSRNANNEIELTPLECADLLRKMAESEGTLQKRAAHMFALTKAAHALEAENENPHIIAIVNYHAEHEAALLWPDKYTKAALEAGREAILRGVRG